ncbi:MAG: HAD-IIIC family phosphatase [Alphaproteobacteria bacterium]|nr:HAD-IIIC family phosphatase [Alphaproteobacteria bacterium]
MAEPVRLVIWDLDGTFWAGTLTEGGHTYIDAHHNIVIELAKRGIVSAICSKNDFGIVKGILEEKGIWDYFVFPSIDWTPKGQRLKQLIEDVQLRPETVLLLDDNPINLREAEHYVPGIQTADDSVIPRLLESPLLKGKDDAELSRLKQYKLLETKKTDQAVAEDNIDFLRCCDIRVTIEHDVEQNLDRAVELINRTNQLNYTKNRLPEELSAAKEQLLQELSGFDIQAGLVRVTDRYGDYGYCGFYLTRTRRGQSRLEYFCFSCRILNMGIENWVYALLGRPAITVAGEVLSPLSDHADIDWIQLGSHDAQDEVRQNGVSAPVVIIRGACLVSPLVHYFQTNAREVIGEFNFVRNRVAVRVDHSLMLRYAIEGVTPEQMAVFIRLGFKPKDFETAFVKTSEFAIRIVSTWVDTQNIIYRHRETGLLVPYKARKMRKKLAERAGDFEKAIQSEEPGSAWEAYRYLQENFDWLGAMPEAEADRTLDVILRAVPEGEPLFLATASEGSMEGGALARATVFNKLIARAIARHPDRLVRQISFAQFAEDDDMIASTHFPRKIYLRVYEEICAICDDLLRSRTHGKRGRTTATAELAENLS